MTEKRIERVLDGSLRPTFLDRPELSSARVPWSGFLMERDPCLKGAATNMYWNHTELIMVTVGGVTVNEHRFGSSQHFFAGPGSITIWPADHEVRSNSWAPVESSNGMTKMITVQLDPSVLRLLSPEIIGCRIVMQPAIQDPVLYSLVRLVEADVQSGCVTGRLYGESLSLALAARVAGCYAVTPERKRTSQTGFSVVQRERIRDLIHANLGNDLSLTELASVVALSPKHFVVLFRATFGITPHQYLLRERIEQAKRLLATQSMSIADIAFSVGFSTQSHFTAAFRKVVGVTPRHYRAEL